jgi:site-specific DNA-methyltransferase (adenine-specific)
LNIVHNCDCMDFMKDCKNNEFELSICDPPYGIDADNFNLRTECHKKLKSKWVDNSIPDKKYFIELFRISKYQIIWGGNYFTKYLAPNNNWIIWYKNNAGVSFSMAEMAWSSIKKNIQIFEYRPMGKLNKIHPTQKPIALYKWLLTNYAKPGQTIFDSHVGSGSIRIACHDLGFDFEGCEIDKDYWNGQEKRYLEYISQQELFDKKELQGLIYE